jgi:hypothetical protein
MVASATSEIRLISHSDVIYWWPAWVFGYVIALITYLQGEPPSPELGYIHPSNNPGILFLSVILLLIIFTHAKLRGIYSVLTIVVVAFIAVLFAWLDWWDDIVRAIPNLSARANLGFYLVFSTSLLLMWLAAFFFFDRLVYWSVRPGQIIEHRLIGGAEHSYDTQGLVFERRDQDLFKHLLLGLGAGDLSLTSGGARKETIHVPNVLFVDQKIRRLQQLIAIKPDQITADAPVRA